MLPSRSLSLSYWILRHSHLPSLLRFFAEILSPPISLLLFPPFPGVYVRVCVCVYLPTYEVVMAYVMYFLFLVSYFWYNRDRVYSLLYNMFEMWKSIRQNEKRYVSSCILYDRVT